MSIVLSVFRKHLDNQTGAAAFAILTAGCEGPSRASELVGVATIYTGEEEDTVLIKLTIDGLTPGSHGMHLHDGRGPTCDDAGVHLQHEGQVHGGPLNKDSPNRHRGSLGNVLADSRGVVRGEITANLTVAECIGRTLVVHENEDDLGLGGTDVSRENGTSGKRLLGGLVMCMA